VRVLKYVFVDENVQEIFQTNMWKFHVWWRC